MWKKRKIDFVLFEDDYEKLIFRFYPRKSSCHSFGDEPPKNKKDIYKVYYSYSVLRQWKDENYTEKVFDCHCDECSIIDEVSTMIKHIIEGKRNITVNFMDKEHIVELLNNEKSPMGDGVSWQINECGNQMVWLYEVVMFDHREIGYRFYLSKNELKEFGEYLNECCEYMLAHGDPI